MKPGNKLVYFSVYVSVNGYSTGGHTGHKNRFRLGITIPHDHMDRKVVWKELIIIVYIYI